MPANSTALRINQYICGRLNSSPNPHLVGTSAIPPTHPQLSTTPGAYPACQYRDHPRRFRDWCRTMPWCILRKTTTTQQMPADSLHMLPSRHISLKLTVHEQPPDATPSEHLCRHAAYAAHAHHSHLHRKSINNQAVGISDIMTTTNS